jgi:hypothetical protein
MDRVLLDRDVQDRDRRWNADRYDAFLQPHAVADDLRHREEPHSLSFNQ